MNIDKHESVGTNWIALYINENNVTYFSSFGVKSSLEEVKKIIGNKHIITNIYRIQAMEK